MLKCPSCNKGYLRKDYGCDIECGECSAVFDSNLKLIPPADPKPQGYKLDPQQRRDLFFDRLVANKSPQQIAEELRQAGIINVCETTVRNYRENHSEEIAQARGGNVARIKIVTPAARR